MRDTKGAREARLAAALRDNLKRRKDQARARRADGVEGDATAHDTATDAGGERGAMAHTISVGDLFVHTVSDGHLDLPRAVFPNAPDGMPPGEAATVRLGANAWVVDAGERRILIDAGSGQALAARFDTVGGLGPQMHAAGISPASINEVILTHMHADHIGGLVADGKPVLPGVTIHVARAEWTYWTDEALPNAVAPEQRERVVQIQGLAQVLAKDVVLHDGAADLDDGVRLVPAPGHTPGHTAVQLSGRAEILLILGDAVIASPLQFQHPEVTYALDSDPAQAVATRRAALDLAARQGFPIAATHLPFPGIGHVKAHGDAFTFEPVSG